jgi:glycosyltransferase involved in cell wall biosynthesis
MKKLKIALFHPWIKSRGGAEKVILEILKNSKHDVDCYTWVYDQKNTFEDFKKFKINIIGLKIFNKFSRSFLLRGLFLFNSLFSKIPLEKYDIFLISTSGVAEFITFRNYKKDKTYAYVHTTLRASSKGIINWNLKHRYKNPFSRKTYLMSAKFYSMLEKKAWKKIDCSIFNSELTRQRAYEKNLIKNKNYVVNPIVDVDRFEKIKTSDKKYFLYLSRFSKDKRQDVLLKAWNEFQKTNNDYKLILAGQTEGSKYIKKLKKTKTENVEILTNLKEESINDLIAKCTAGIFIPLEEDFGIVPFEFLAAGKSIIVINKGGYYPLIKNHKQVFTIKEKEGENHLISQINKTLNLFLKSKIKPKKIKFNRTPEAFVREIEKIIT